MIADLQDLAQRLTEQEWWEWRAGMRGLWHDGTPGRAASEEEAIDYYDDQGRLRCQLAAGVDMGGYLPDLTDWPTIGALIGVAVGAADGVSLSLTRAPNGLWYLACLDRSPGHLDPGGAVALWLLGGG